MDVFNKTVFEVDLTDGSYEIYELEEENFYRYLGGRGLGVNYVEKDKDYIVIARGILSKIPGIPGRASAVFISPKTKGIFHSNSGGIVHWMRPYAIILKGSSDEKIIVKIGEKVEFLDASEIFDFDFNQTVETLEEKHKNSIVLAIGNSNSINERLGDNWHGNFGRGGLGYEFRKRNIKAIIIEKNRGLSSPMTQKFKEVYKELIVKLMDNNIIQKLSKWGTVGMLLDELGKRGWLPIDIDYKKYLEDWKKYDLKKKGCMGCPIQCKKNFEFWGGLVSFYIQGIKKLEEIEKVYEEYSRKGLDAVNNESVVCFKRIKLAGLALATSNRGDLNQLILTRLFRENLDVKDIDIVDYVIETQNEIAVVDSLVTCGFTLYAWDLEDYSKILNSLGYSFTEDELRKIGNRIYKKEMEINLELGFKYRKDVTEEELLKNYLKRRNIKNN